MSFEIASLAETQSGKTSGHAFDQILPTESKGVVYACTSLMSAFGGRADIAWTCRYVRY